MSVKKTCLSIVAKCASVIIFAAAALTGCETNPPKVERPAALSEEALLEQGIQFAVEDLIVQAIKTPNFQPQPKTGLSQVLSGNTPVPKDTLVIDNTVDGVSGQTTVTTKYIDSRLLPLIKERLTSHLVSPVNAESIAVASYVVTSTIAQALKGDDRSGFKINMSLTDMRSGFILAQSVARVKSAGVDETPTKFFRDSPSLSKDRAVEGQIKTAQTQVGAEADGLYLSKLPLSALISQGDTHYDEGRCAEALKFFESAALRPDGMQLHVLNGIYLCHNQLGHQEAAETYFGKIVAYGLATNNLSVKFLFSPGSTEFVSDPKINSAYTMWLKQIAKETAASKMCLLVIGHTSKTGTDQYNDRLSLQRGIAIQRSLESYAPALVGKLQPLGKGFRENMVGSGSDDLRDALDRRVEFKARAC